MLEQTGIIVIGGVAIGAIIAIFYLFCKRHKEILRFNFRGK